MFAADTSTPRLKIYAAGGENDLHAHPDEDHASVVLDDEAVFSDQAGNETVTRRYEGVFLPRGTYYRFRSAGTGNLAILRIGSSASLDGPGLYRTGLDGEPLRHNPSQRTAGTDTPIESGRFFGDDEPT